MRRSYPVWFRLGRVRISASRPRAAGTKAKMACLAAVTSARRRGVHRGVELRSARSRAPAMMRLSAESGARGARIFLSQGRDVTWRVRLSYLAPDITQAVLDGRVWG